MITGTGPIYLHIDGQQAPGPDRAGLEAENARLRDEVARLREGEEPADLHEPVTAGGHLLWMLNHSTAAVRLDLANGLMQAMRHSNACLESHHEGRLQRDAARLTRAESILHHAVQEARRLAVVSDGTGRGVALTMEFVLTRGAEGRM
ncbi:hypothetical protein ACLQ2N_32885 [Streptomyces sp. DT224]|uniref:hypothetical protein n=1 Tax=Streptomyces sp. DT224 TaxID=3393426 RepID=UPI003CFA8179